jgi:hypothetical protein
LKLPQLWKSKSVAFGIFFWMDFHQLFEKASQKTLRLFHSFNQVRRRVQVGYFLNDLTTPAKVTFLNELIGIGSTRI